ncbi:MAG: tyrosine--tRNA ligase [Candidatus Aenigmarchaeota archaeon]|nr:tyrosine--tRNA ligase [Candidatus Aenigmarchaeota archaeon]
MNVEEKLKLIKRDTEEIVTEEELKNLLEKKKHPISYWGVAPTGPPHIGYYRSVAKQIDLINAGFRHKVLIADLHAYLDDRKAPWEELEIRTKIYEKCLDLFGLKGVEFVRGSDFETNEKYFLDVLRMSGLLTTTRAERAAREVCRMNVPKVSELIYPIMQSLDCVGLEVDVAYGGIDQRHVYMLSREYLPKLGYDKPISIFTPLGISLSGQGKMSASEKKSRLELYASEDKIRESIKNAFCPAKVVDGNPVLEYIKFIVFQRKGSMKIIRPEKFGGDTIYKSYEELEKDFVSGEIHPLDLKNSLSEELIEILRPIRKFYESHLDMFKIFEK